MTETVYVEEYMIAPAGVRFGNLFIDIIVQAVLAYAVGFLSVLAGELLDWDSLYIWFRKMDRGDAVFFLLTVHVLYYMFFEGLWQLTPGKMVTGTRVVTTEGQKPSFAAIVIRSFCRLIPFEGFSFMGEKVWGLHDRLANTYVVDHNLFKKAVHSHKATAENKRIA